MNGNLLIQIGTQVTNNWNLSSLMSVAPSPHETLSRRHTINTLTALSLAVLLLIRTN